MHSLTSDDGSDLVAPSPVSRVRSMTPSREDDDAVEELVHDAQEADVAPSTSQTKTKTSPLGLGKARRKGQTDPDDYMQKYPDDPYGEEMNANSRLWRVYLDEAGRLNTELTEGLRENLDVLFIFAGLFSAVVTTIVVESAGNLRPDYTQVTASLLHELLDVQHAVALGNPANFAPVAPTTFAPSTADKWINGLWFSSLTLSIATALFAALSRQWLQHFLSSVSGTARDRARIIQSRRDAMDTWHVEEIISLLPVILHLSIFAFFIGLVIYLVSLCEEIGVTVGVMVSVTLALYFISTLLPLRYPRCSYVTPLSRIIHASLNQAVILWDRLPKRQKTTSIEADVFNILTNIPNQGQETTGNSQLLTLASLERKEVADAADFIDARVIVWLYSVSSPNPSVNTVLLYALAGLRRDFTHRDLLVASGITEHLPQVLQPNDNNRHQLADSYAQYIKETDEKSAEVYMRMSLQLERTRPMVPYGTAQNTSYSIRLPHHAMLMLAFHPHCNNKVQRIANTPPSYYTIKCAINFNEFLASETILRLHPIMWEHLFYGAGYTMNAAKRSLSKNDSDKWRLKIGAMFVSIYSNNPKLLVGVQETKVISPNYAERPITISEFDCLPAWVYVLSSYNIPKDFDPTRWNGLSVAELYRSRPVLVLSFTLDIYESDTTIQELCTHEITCIQKIIRTTASHASAFLWDDISGLAANGLTEEQAWLNNLNPDEHSAKLAQRKKVYSRLLKRAFKRIRHLIGDDNFMEKDYAYRSELLQSCTIFTRISNDLASHDLLSSPPATPSVVINFIHHLLASKAHYYPYGVTEDERSLVIWLNTNADATLEQFIAVDGLQLVLTAVSEIWTNSSVGIHQRTLISSILIIDAVIRASLCQEGVGTSKAYLTTEDNLKTICRTLFKSLILEEKFGPSADELSMSVYWPRPLFQLAKETSGIASGAWKTAIQAVIQDTPSILDESRLTKDHFRFVEDLKIACGFGSRDDQTLKQLVPLPLKEVEQVQVLLSSVDESSRFVHAEDTYILVEYSVAALYLTADMKLITEPIQSEQVAAIEEREKASNSLNVESTAEKTLATANKRIEWLQKVLRRHKRVDDEENGLAEKSL